MPREEGRNRGEEFLFNPGHFMNDEAVLAMSTAGRGAYAMLFCALWHQPEPGIAVANARVLAALARVGDEEWARLEAEVAAAFDLETRPGHWVQKRMVLTHRRQTEYLRAQADAGRRGGATRWGSRAVQGRHGVAIGSPRRPDNGTGDGGRGTGDGGRIQEEPEHSGQLPLADEGGRPGAARRGMKKAGLDARGALPDGEITADEAFEEVFWPPYPRKRDKQEAHRAWRELKFSDLDDEAVAELMRDLRQCVDVEWAGWPEHKIPYPATWLRRRKPAR